jgi:hypothetical protein
LEAAPLTVVFRSNGSEQQASLPHRRPDVSECRLRFVPREFYPGLQDQRAIADQTRL